MRWRKWFLGILVSSLCVWVLVKVAPSSPGDAQVHSDSSEPSQYLSSGVFTTAHPSAASAVTDFLDRHPEHPVQPIAYTHKVHLANGLQCEMCHVGVDQGPDARIPGVAFCMTCHQAIDTDNPEIKKIAAYAQRGEEIPWVRVYGYNQSAHVKFNHAPHIRAGVQCASCHGDMTTQTTAERKVNLNMGFCIECHRAKQVSVDCELCHN